MQYRARAGEDLIAQPTGIDSKLARIKEREYADLVRMARPFG